MTEPMYWWLRGAAFATIVWWAVLGIVHVARKIKFRF